MGARSLRDSLISEEMSPTVCWTARSRRSTFLSSSPPSGMYSVRVSKPIVAIFIAAACRIESATS